MDKQKILLIEDDDDLAKVIVARLEGAGYECLVASDAYQGVQFAHKLKPDLIILDLILPAGEGLAVLRRIKLSAYTRGIPVVVLTGVKDEIYKERVLKEGAQAYLEKPYDSTLLINTIQSILAK